LFNDICGGLISLGWIKLIEFERPKVIDGTLIQGLPGLGFVGKIAVDYVIEILKLPKFAELYSDYLLLADGRAGVYVDLKGILDLPRYEFYLFKEKNIIFLAGNTQPVSWAQYEIAEKVIKYVRELGVSRIITLGGTVTPSRKKEVYTATTNEKLMDMLRKYDVKKSIGGAITGAAGIMLGISKLYNMDGFTLLGNVGKIYPDVEAAKAVLTVISKMYEFKIDFSKMDKIIEDIKIKSKAAGELTALIERERTEREKEKETRQYYV